MFIYLYINIYSYLYKYIKYICIYLQLYIDHIVMVCIKYESELNCFRNEKTKKTPVDQIQFYVLQRKYMLTSTTNSRLPSA